MKRDDFGILVLHFGVASTISLISVGLIGNFLTITAYFRTKIGNIQPFLYLVMLAISDSIILISYVVIYFRAGFEDNNFFFFLRESVTMSSNWLIVAFTYNRYISLKYPLLTKSSWILRKTKLIITIILATFTTYGTAAFLLNYILYDSDGFWNVVSFISYVIRFIIPLPLILFFNLSTLSTMVKYKKDNLTYLRNTSEQYNLTKLFLVSSSMMMCLVPYEILNGACFLMDVNKYKV